MLKKYILLLCLLFLGAASSLLAADNYVFIKHRTGLRKPTEKEKAWLAKRAHPFKAPAPNKLALARYAAAPGSAPGIAASAINAEFLPPVGNQGSQGSCAAWAACYYVKTYQDAKEHGWTDIATNPAHQMSPAFGYNLDNAGVDDGSYPDQIMQIMCDHGCAALSDMPYNESDYITWPSSAAWKNAITYRADTSSTFGLSTISGITSLKQLIANGDICVIGVEAYDNLMSYPGEPFSGSHTISNDVIYANSGADDGGHAMAVIGYDDTRTYTKADGTTGTGAFLLVNSWGTGWGINPSTAGIHSDGFLWMSYEYVQKDSYYETAYTMTDRTGYTPTTFGVFGLDHPSRGDLDVHFMGGNDQYNPDWDFDCLPNLGGSQPVVQQIVVDLSTFTINYSNPFWLAINNSGGQNGTVTYMSVLTPGGGEIRSTNIPKNITSLNTYVELNAISPISISSMTPDIGVTGPINTAIYGSGFFNGLTVQLLNNGDIINASNVNVVSSTTIQCTFDLTGRADGYWNLVVSSTAVTASLPNAFEIVPFLVNDMSPYNAFSDGVAQITVIGQGFTSGLGVKLSQPGQSDIIATSVNVVNSTTIICNVDLTGKTKGYWDITVYDGSGFSDDLPGVFYIFGPSGFSGIGVSTASIKWSWNLQNGATYYRLYASTSTGPANFLTEIDTSLTSGTTGFIEMGISTNTSRTRFIRMGNADGLSTPSSSLTVYTLADPPSSVSVSSMTTSQISISYLNNETNLNTLYESTDSAHWVFVSTSTASPAIYTGFKGDTTYYFQMGGLNGNRVENTQYFSQIVSTLTFPSAPGGVGGTAVSVNSISWYWSTGTYTSSDIQGYRVYSSTGPLLHTINSIGTTTWAEVNLSTNTQYTRYVRAFNSTGESGNSSPMARYTLAASPTGIAIDTASVTSHTAKVSWANNGASTFSVDVSTDGVNWIKNQAINIPQSGAGGYTIYGLRLSTTYYFAVWGYNGDGIITVSSSASNTAVMTMGYPKSSTVINSGSAVISQANTIAGTVVLAISQGALTSNFSNSYLLFNTDASNNPTDFSKQDVDNATNKLKNIELIPGSIFEIHIYDLTGSTFTSTFSKSVTLSYAAASIANTQAEGLSVFWLNPASKAWEIVPGDQILDKVNKTVKVTLTHLSMYGLMIINTAKNNLDNVKVYPNPLNTRTQRQGMTIANLTSSATIRIYNVAGQLIKTISYSGVSGQTTWDGKNDSGNMAASGVYIMYVSAPEGTKIIKAAIEK